MICEFTWCMLHPNFEVYTCLQNVPGEQMYLSDSYASYLVTLPTTKQEINAKKGKRPKHIYLTVPVFLKCWPRVLRR